MSKQTIRENVQKYMSMCDCSDKVSQTSYINNVSVGMVVSAATNKKEREDKMIAQFLPDPEGNSSRWLSHYKHTTARYSNYKTNTHQWISASKHTEHVKPTLQRLISSSISITRLP